MYPIYHIMFLFSTSIASEIDYFPNYVFDMYNSFLRTIRDANGENKCTYF